MKSGIEFEKHASYANHVRWKHRDNSMPGGGGGTSHQRDSFDPETGALLYWALMCSVDHRSYTKEKKKEMDAELLNALEVAKDLPLEKVWADLKGGDFDAFKKKYAGSVTGKQYGV